MQTMENLTGLIKALYKRRKAIIGGTILVGILTAAFSLMLPDWYQGKNIFYVASPDLAKPSPIGLSESKVEYYGEGEDIDRILTIAESSQMANYLIEHFDLMDHYKIDPDNPKAGYKTQLKFNKHFNVVKTKYEALSITFESTNPILSRDVANVAMDKVNESAQKLIKDSQTKLLTTFESNIKSKNITLATLNHKTDSLRNLYSIYDTKTQGQVIAEQLSKVKSSLQMAKSKKSAYQDLGGSFQDSVRILSAAAQAYSSQLSNLKKDAADFNKGISIVLELEQQQDEASTQLGLDMERYKLLKSKLETDFDAIHVVEPATKPVVKSRPRRTILVLGASIFAFLFFSLAAILTEFYKKVDWKSILNE